MQPRHPLVRFLYCFKPKSSLLIVTNLGSWVVFLQIVRCSPSVRVLFSLLRCGGSDFLIVWQYPFLRMSSLYRGDLTDFLLSFFGPNSSLWPISQITKIRWLCASYQSQFCFVLWSLSEKSFDTANFFLSQLLSSWLMTKGLIGPFGLREPWNFLVFVICSYCVSGKCRNLVCFQSFDFANHVFWRSCCSCLESNCIVHVQRSTAKWDFWSETNTLLNIHRRIE